VAGNQRCRLEKQVVLKTQYYGEKTASRKQIMKNRWKNEVMEKGSWGEKLSMRMS